MFKTNIYFLLKAEPSSVSLWKCASVGKNWDREEENKTFGGQTEVWPAASFRSFFSSLIFDRLPCSVFPPHAFCCFCFAVSGNEDCLWYVDKNGTWHNGFDCPLITFCCGNCHRRYCCLDAFKMITEREQKRCMLFQFRWGRRQQQQQQGFNLMTYLLIYSTPRVSVCVHDSRPSLQDRVSFISVRQADTLTSCWRKFVATVWTKKKNPFLARCILEYPWT